MDLSKLTQSYKDDEIRVKTLLELSTKKYNLQKELENSKLRLTVKQGELKKLQKEVISLQSQVPVLEKQEEISRNTARHLTRKLLVKSTEIEKVQENVWRKINSFVTDANANVAPPVRTTSEENASGKNAGKRREDKIRQLQLEIEMEAMHSYEKYQSAKMEELKLMRELVEGESFVI